MSKIDAFFDEYEAVFETHSKLGGGARLSSRFPHVTLRLCGSEYHPTDVGVDVDWLFSGAGGLEEQVLEYVKELATKHGLVLATFTLEADDQTQFRAAGFVACEHRGVRPWRGAVRMACLLARDAQVAGRGL